MISIAFALALAASAPGAGGCTLLNPAACRDAGALAGDAPAEGEVLDETDQAQPGEATAETNVVKE